MRESKGQDNIELCDMLFHDSMNSDFISVDEIIIMIKKTFKKKLRIMTKINERNRTQQRNATVNVINIISRTYMIMKSNHR